MTSTILKERCEHCNKVAEIDRETLIEDKDETKPDRKFIFLKCGHLIVKEINKSTPFHTLISNSWKPEVKSCKHSFDKNQCSICLEYKPFPFQTEAMKFLEAALSTQKGGAVFDEMGLGKTIDVCGIIKFCPDKAPFLVVTKSGIKFQFFKEILRWCGPEFLPQIIEKSNDFIIPGLKVYIVSYDLFVFKTRKIKGKTVTQGFDVKRFIEHGIKTIILDECQQIKNPDASRTQEIRKIAAHTQVIELSGTPWKNRGSEFFTALNLLDPRKFPSYQGFLNQWVDYYYHGDKVKQGGIRKVEQFKEYIKDIAIRREVADVAVEMPDVIRTLHYAELDSIEQKVYDESVSDFVSWYNNLIIGGEEDKLDGMNLLAKMAKMRHITGLAKIPATVDLVKSHIEELQKKVCIFVHHKDVGDILHNEMKKELNGTPIFKLTAELDAQSRFEVQEKFNNTEPCILIASTLASGEGINLQTCGYGIMHERQWNPQNEDQAAPGRFRRIGSSYANVNVTFVTASGTIDEVLAEIVERKRGYFHNAMNKGEMPVWNQNSFAKELAEGIVKKYNESGKKSLGKILAVR